MTLGPILNIELEGLPLFKRGKVREVYEAGDYLIIVATDRISAFDVVMPNGIPGKGRVLTSMSRFWFRMMEPIIGHHLVTAEAPRINELAGIKLSHPEMLEGRTMLVLKSQPYPMECVVRGYLAGSGWKEYRENGTLAGKQLPPGLLESQRLPEAVFTPSTKEASGHDRNLTEEEAVALVGLETYRRLAGASLALYHEAAAYAEKRGIIIADTKFEFGRHAGKTILIDEVLTPDSSRFWPLAGYRPGSSQPSFDKQFVRDWLESTGWDKQPPAPVLPEDIVLKTAEKYREAEERLIGSRPS